jgi:hypothetical protein
MVALGVAPDGRACSLAESIPRNGVQPGWLRPDEARRLVADRLGTVSKWSQHRRSQAADRGTVQLLDAVCAGLEAQVAEISAATSP